MKYSIIASDKPLVVKYELAGVEESREHTLNPGDTMQYSEADCKILNKDELASYIFAAEITEEVETAKENPLAALKNKLTDASNTDSE